MGAPQAIDIAALPNQSSVKCTVKLVCTVMPHLQRTGLVPSGTSGFALPLTIAMCWHSCCPELKLELCMRPFQLRTLHSWSTLGSRFIRSCQQHLVRTSCGAHTQLQTAGPQLSVIVCRAPLYVHPCTKPLKRNNAGYCVCSGLLAVPATPQQGHRATCTQLCANSLASQAIVIPSRNSCPQGAPL
jgi:hypothetical protein